MDEQTQSLLEERLNKLLRRCGHVLYHQANHTQQDEVLQILAKEGPMNQKQIQEHLSVQAGSASELISKLENKQFVQRSRDEKDRRRVVLSLTERGQLAARIHAERPTEDLFTALSIDEKEQMIGLLNKLLVSWGFQEV